MKLNYLAFAVPLFLLLMWVEFYISRKKGRQHHQFDESIANLNVGIAERLADLFTTGLFFFIFDWIHQHYAVFNIKANIFTWLFLFLATDFVWYWYHRFGHEVNVLWSVHVVHHQSEDFNYTVSGRITVLQAFARGLFWSVLPVIGFPAPMIAVLLLIHGTYPFFTHTQLVGKLGWLESIFVTPSHHRVHHSSNPEYLDKNYGDVLIIWDKLFGTFAEEKSVPVYGLVQPMKSHSFLWQHFHFLLEMGVAFKRAKGLRNKWRILFGRPGAIDPRIKSGLERKLLTKKKVALKSYALIRFIKWQTAITLSVLFATALLHQYLSAIQLTTAAFFVLLGAINTGAMLEQHRWVFHIDFIRLHLVGLFIYTFYPYPAVSTVIVCVSLLTFSFYKTLCSRYRAFLYAY